MNLLTLTIHLALWSLLAGSLTAASPEETAVRFLGRSETVFLGSLIDAKSSPSADGRLILTHYVFAVEETFPLPVHGRDACATCPTPDQSRASGSMVEIVEYGGTVGDTTLTLSHGVGYRYGSGYLIFAEKDESGWLRTTGGPQGRLAVTLDGSGQKMVRLYPGHPLSGLMNGPPHLFHRLDEIRDRLREASLGAPR